jgi:hypothetical protein
MQIQKFLLLIRNLRLGSWLAYSPEELCWRECLLLVVPLKLDRPKDMATWHESYRLRARWLICDGRVS